MLASDGSWIEKNQGTGDWRLTTGGCRVEHRQQAAPRVADDLGAVERQLVGDGSKVFDVGLPGYGRGVIRSRLAAPALVIEHQLVILGQREHLGQEILVIGSGTSVENEEPAPARWTISAPVQGDRCRRSEAGIARNRNWGHVEGKASGESWHAGGRADNVKSFRPGL